MFKHCAENCYRKSKTVNIPVTAGTLLVLAILNDGGPFPDAVKPCTVILNVVSGIRPVARYFSASLTVEMTVNVSFSNMDSFKYKTNFQAGHNIFTAWI